MPVKYAKKQDYLTVEGHAARLRQDATTQLGYLSTATVTNLKVLTTDATRLDGIEIAADAVLASGTVTIVVSRLRDGATTTLATVPLTTANNVVADDVKDFSSVILPGVGVKAGDAIQIVSTPAGPPTAINFALVLQFAGNGPK